MGEVRSIRDYQVEASEAAELAVWGPECLESERKFGTRTARLYPLLKVEGGVETPKGPGTLLQAINGEAHVLLMRTKAGEAGRDMNGTKYRPVTVFAGEQFEEVKPYRRRES